MSRVISPHGHQHTHVAWTCLWCGQINAFNWETEDEIIGPEISMLCDFCGRHTLMKQDKRPEIVERERLGLYP